MKSINALNVLFHNTLVGRLTMTPDGLRCAFQYDKDWLINGFSISPLDLPLKPDLFIAKETPFWGNFGIFEDSLPDGYGRYLLNRMLKKQNIDETTLNPIQRLSIVGTSGMGALCYIPEIMPNEKKTLPLLHHLQEIALDILSDKSDKDIDMLYFNSGNSGGCRPKCLYHDQDGEWIVKFRHTYDPINMGNMEFEYNIAARNCGITMPDFKLLENKYFATKRFDIDNCGNRLHVATAGALLNESIHQPMLDYRTLLQLTGYLTQDPLQVEEMYRRMIFNILTENKDDHAKNFSFIYHNNKWQLAPAYDLTHCPAGCNGEHATSVNMNGNPTLNDVIIVGQNIKIKKARCLEIISQVTTGCEKIKKKNLI